MKSLKWTFVMVLVAGINFSLSAQDANAIVSKSIVINASADAVWERLRALDRIEELTPDFVGDSWIDGPTGIGAKRSCTAPGLTRETAEKAAYTETVVAYDDEKRYYAYAVSGVPAKNMLNSFKVVDLGYKKCMVVWNSTGWTFMENPQMNEQQFLSFLDTVSDQLMFRLFELHNQDS